jgi:hypothetical protein
LDVGAANVTQAKENANLAAATLQQVTPIVLWKASLKAKEVESRVSKATSVSSELLQILCEMPDKDCALHTECKLLCERLTVQVKTVEENIDLVQKLKSKDLFQHLEDLVFWDLFQKLGVEMDAAVLSSILFHVGNKLAEDGNPADIACVP